MVFLQFFDAKLPAAVNRYPKLKEAKNLAIFVSNVISQSCSKSVVPNFGWNWYLTAFKVIFARFNDGSVGFQIILS